jgi:hypothetical protein
LSNKISINSGKPLILVGLDAELCKGDMVRSDIMYDLSADHKFYISSSEKTLKQRFFRQIGKLIERKEWFFNYWISNPDDAQKKLFRFVDLNKWKLNNNECDKLYSDRGYIIMNADDIFKNVCEILDAQLNQTDIVAGGAHIQFILFGDVMTGPDQWMHDPSGNKIDFIEKLQTVGNVIILKPNYLNFMKYSLFDNKGTNWIYKSKDDSITDFKIADLQFENYSAWVYSQINPMFKYVAISLDQGCHFAKHFCNTYPENCVQCCQSLFATY